MATGVLSSLQYVLFVVILPVMLADHCPSYWDSYGDFHNVQHCGSMYCCGDCSKPYCCYDKAKQLTPKNLESCPGRDPHKKGSSTAMIVGIVLGTILLVLPCVGLIICCLAPCCYCYKKFRKRRNQAHISVINTANVVSVPSQPSHPSQPLHPSYPGYQSVPAGPPIPTAPPLLYTASTNPPLDPVVFVHGQPVHPSDQPSLPPPHTDETVQLPYNPSYGTTS
ncbi:uncharacterized protein KZ484_001151 [Pholidichthys leucotaenia]